MPEDELDILETFRDTRVTKMAKHSAIIVNRHQPRNKQVDRRPQDSKEESLKVAEIIAWMLVTGTRQVTVFDQDGKLRDEQSVIAREVKKRLERQNNKD